MYLTATQPDIMQAASIISRHMENPKEIHHLVARRILRYLRGTTDFGLIYKKGEKTNLFGFSDKVYAGDLNDRRSTFRFFMLSSAAVSWSSKKQPLVTLSTTEAEFVAAASCACQALWLRYILEDQVADIFTKLLKLASFLKPRKLLGVCTMDDPIEGGFCINR